jgi:hypothetical protein
LAKDGLKESPLADDKQSLPWECCSDGQHSVQRMQKSVEICQMVCGTDFRRWLRKQCNGLGRQETRNTLLQAPTKTPQTQSHETQQKR